MTNTIECPHCASSEAEALGILGRRVHLRCVNCAGDYHLHIDDISDDILADLENILFQ